MKIESVNKNINWHEIQADQKHAYIEVSSLEEVQTLIRESEVPVIVDFYAAWCGPCKRLAPVFEDAANQLSPQYLFVKVNVDTVPGAKEHYQVRAYPTMLEFENGELSKNLIGSNFIMDYLNDLIKNKN